MHISLQNSELFKKLIHQLIVVVRQQKDTFHIVCQVFEKTFVVGVVLRHRARAFHRLDQQFKANCAAKSTALECQNAG